MTASEPTLTEALAARGLTHRSAGRNGKREILSGDDIVFMGTAGETWTWLRVLDVGRMFHA